MAWDHRYRQLEKREIIQDGDEVGNIWKDKNGNLIWKKATQIGSEAPDPSFTSHRWYRRLKPIA